MACIYILIDKLIMQVYIFFQGKTWGFVWGKGSKSYSEEVVRNYVCRYRFGAQRMIPALIATRHRFGPVRRPDMGRFGRLIQGLINEGEF